MIPAVQNILNVVHDKRYQKRNDDPIGIMIHRVGVDDKYKILLGYDAVSICAHFTGRDHTYPDVAKATGSQLAYTFMIGGDRGPGEFDGIPWQCLPLDEIGWHARVMSSRYIGIACIGDFRSKPPSSAQWSTVVQLVWRLCAYYGFRDSEVVGHGEIAKAHGGEKAPGGPFACPGDLFDVANLRTEVGSLRAGHRAGLIDGVTESA